MIKKYTKRISYIDRIKPFIGVQLIKIITGQRRIGKSYLLMQLQTEIKSLYKNVHFISIDKELASFSFIQNSEDLNNYVLAQLHSTKTNFLFIDEIQEIVDFELCLRSLLNQELCDIYVTGSNANMLSGELATTLSGRTVSFQVHALSYLEFLIFHHLQDSQESLELYLTIGGMPFLKNIPNDTAIVNEYLTNVYSTILLKDVIARENFRNTVFLDSLVQFLVSNTGNTMSALNIHKYLKSQQIQLPTQTILNYLHALTNAFFINKVSRADVKGLKIFEIGEKFYFEDLGLRNCLRPMTLKADVGQLMENAVYLHLKNSGYTVFVGKLGDKEIDFIAEKNGERTYIQVAYLLNDEATRAREFGNLLLIKDNYQKLVVTMDPFSMKTSFKGIKQLHLRQFLTSFE